MSVTLIAAFTGALSGAAHVSAQISPPISGGVGICDGSGQSYNTFMTKVEFSGAMYIRLAAGEPNTQSMVYVQSLQDEACSRIGTVIARSDQWTRVGSLNALYPNGAAFIVSASGLATSPYSAVAQLLVLPSPQACTPSQICAVSYHGYSGILQPVTLSNATDEVAVMVGYPISSVETKNVTYYADSEYLYGGEKLAPFDRNYLQGGVHHVAAVVELKNGETVTINGTIDMGSDYTGLLFLRSAIYKSTDRALLFALMSLIGLVLMLILYIVRLIYKHHRYKLDHGLANYGSAQVTTKNDGHSGDSVITG